jgi:hypothetical protein
VQVRNPDGAIHAPVWVAGLCTDGRGNTESVGEKKPAEAGTKSVTYNTSWTEDAWIEYCSNGDAKKKPAEAGKDCARSPAQRRTHG